MHNRVFPVHRHHPDGRPADLQDEETVPVPAGHGQPRAERGSDVRDLLGGVRGVLPLRQYGLPHGTDKSDWYSSGHTGCHLYLGVRRGEEAADS